MVWSVVPKSSILISIMSESWQILDSLLSRCEIESVALDIEIHASFVTSMTAFWAVSSNSSSFWVETLVKVESCPVNPSVVKLILDKYSELNVAIVAEVDKWNLEEVPVIESKVVCVYFFVKV